MRTKTNVKAGMGLNYTKIEWTYWGADTDENQDESEGWWSTGFAWQVRQL